MIDPTEATAKLSLLLIHCTNTTRFSNWDEWSSSAITLRYASAISSVGISPEHLDPYAAGSYCENAASYDEVAQYIAEGFFLRLTRFQLIWNAYETLRACSTIAHFMALKELGHVDKWRSQRRMEVMSMKARKLSAVLS